MAVDLDGDEAVLRALRDVGIDQVFTPFMGYAQCDGCGAWFAGPKSCPAWLIMTEVEHATDGCKGTGCNGPIRFATRDEWLRALEVPEASATVAARR